MEQTLGKRIAQHRKRLGLTQDQLAEQLGVTAQAVSKWENDLSCPDITALPKLAKIFRVTTDELLGAAQEMPVHEAEVVHENPAEEESGLHVHNQNFEFHWDGGRRSALCLALLVLAVGVQLLLIRILDSDLSFWEILWPTTLLLLGIFGLTKRFTFFRLGSVLLGVFFLLYYWCLLPFSLSSDVVLPVVLVILGLSLLVGAVRKPRKSHFHISHDGSKKKPTCTTDGGWLDFSASFSEEDDRCISMPELRGGKISTSFGEYTIDLSGVQSVREGCTLDAHCSFGELELLVPRRFAVKPNSSTAFGEFEVHGHPDGEPQGIIFLEASVSFGEITVKYI